MFVDFLTEANLYLGISFQQDQSSQDTSDTLFSSFLILVPVLQPLIHLIPVR